MANGLGYSEVRDLGVEMVAYSLLVFRYRTVMCNRGGECSRVLCFFAHSYEELRVTAGSRVSGTKDELSDVMLPNLKTDSEECSGQVRETLHNWLYPQIF